MTIKGYLVLVAVVFVGLTLLGRIGHDDQDPPPPASTTPVYPLGNPATNCAEYIATNTYHEGC